MVEKALSINEPDSTEKVYLTALAEIYRHATGWDTRRQVLSIMADQVPFSKLQLFIPGITYYRVKAAHHHKQSYGRGVKVDKLTVESTGSFSDVYHQSPRSARSPVINFNVLFPAEVINPV